jgi:hypothetical protein
MRRRSFASQSCNQGVLGCLKDGLCRFWEVHLTRGGCAVIVSFRNHSA